MKIFVTGTDTGVGKTEVTAALVRALRQQGQDARAIKPVETGWVAETSDAARLAAASGRTIEETVGRTFRAPRAPNVAARLEGGSLDLDDLVGWCAAQAGAPLLIEGAGGWVVPIDHRRTSELAARTAEAVLVVARAGLGTINHSVLTVEAARAALPIAGIVLSRRPDEDLDFATENATEIEAMTGERCAVYPDQLEVVVSWFRLTAR